MAFLWIKEKLTKSASKREKQEDGLADCLANNSSALRSCKRLFSKKLRTSSNSESLSRAELSSPACQNQWSHILVTEYNTLIFCVEIRVSTENQPSECCVQISDTIVW